MISLATLNISVALREHPTCVSWDGSSIRAAKNMVLVLVELLFTIPISNAKVERLFSLMNRIKTDCRATLGESTPNKLTTVHMEGPAFQYYDPTPAIQSWLSIAARRPNQRIWKRYKRRDSATTSTVIIEESSTDERGNELRPWLGSSGCRRMTETCL